jgi:uncharacterized repeat protein (TIGR03803 family)
MAAWLALSRRGGATNAVGRFTRSAPSQTFTMLYTFAGDLASAQPGCGSLAIDAFGNLYGATQSGGIFSSGPIYRVTPAGEATVLYSFSVLGRQTTCVEPNAGLVLDVAGNIYRTANDGGNSGHGCVFKLSPSGQLTILHNFVKSPTFPIGADGEYPNGGGGRVSAQTPWLERDRFRLKRLNGAITLQLFVWTRDSRFGLTPFEAITL